MLLTDDATDSTAAAGSNRRTLYVYTIASTSTYAHTRARIRYYNTTKKEESVNTTIERDRINREFDSARVTRIDTHRCARRGRYEKKWVRELKKKKAKLRNTHAHMYELLLFFILAYIIYI